MRTQAKHARPVRHPRLLLLSLGVPALLAAGPVLATGASAADLAGAATSVAVPGVGGASLLPTPAPGPVGEVTEMVGKAVASPSPTATVPPAPAPSAAPAPAPAATAAPTAAPRPAPSTAGVRPNSGAAPRPVAGPARTTTSSSTGGTGTAALDPARITGGLLAAESMAGASSGGGTGTAVLPPLLAAAAPLPELAPSAPLPQAAAPLAVPLADLVGQSLPTVPGVPAGLPTALVLGAGLVALAAGAAAVTEGRLRGRSTPR